MPKKANGIFSDERQKLDSRDKELGNRFGHLCDIIAEHDKAVVAFSGGTDSSLLAYVSSKLLGRCLCITFSSFLTPHFEAGGAEEFAKAYGLEHEFAEVDLLGIKEVGLNHPQRCYYCKSALFDKLEEVMMREGLEVIFEGSNADDVGEYRPGRRAVGERGIKSPILEAGISKADVRRLSKILGLKTWNRPANPCLATRFPYNTELTIVGLARVDKAETLLREQGYKVVRVRSVADMAKIELGKGEEIDILKLREMIPYFKALGFRRVTVDPEGYKSGAFD